MNTLPSLLSASRILLLVPVLICLVWWGSFGRETAALIVLLLIGAAAITDIMDGWVARRLGLESEFGAVLDQIADKLFLSGTMIVALAEGWIALAHSVAVVLLILRDIAVSGLREYAGRQDRPVGVGWWGKCKTALVFAALCLFVSIPLWGDSLGDGVAVLAGLALWCGVVLSLYSAYFYVRAVFGSRMT